MEITLEKLQGNLLSINQSIRGAAKLDNDIKESLEKMREFQRKAAEKYKEYERLSYLSDSSTYGNLEKNLLTQLINIKKGKPVKSIYLYFGDNAFDDAYGENISDEDIIELICTGIKSGLIEELIIKCNSDKQDIQTPLDILEALQDPKSTVASYSIIQPNIFEDKEERGTLQELIKLVKQNKTAIILNEEVVNIREPIKTTNKIIASDLIF